MDRSRVSELLNNIKQHTGGATQASTPLFARCEEKTHSAPLSANVLFNRFHCERAFPFTTPRFNRVFAMRPRRKRPHFLALLGLPSQL